MTHKSCLQQNHIKSCLMNQHLLELTSAKCDPYVNVSNSTSHVSIPTTCHYSFIYLLLIIVYLKKKTLCITCTFRLSIEIKALVTCTYNIFWNI